MSYALCGSHRTGKSTLARAFAERHAIPFVETRVSGVFEALGRSPKVDYPFGERLRIQQAVLEHLEHTYATAPARFITDRTPIDLLAYTLADVRRENVSGELAEQMMRYVDACFAASNRYFSTLLVVQPGIRLIEAEGKAPANPAYIEHLNQLVMGLVCDQRNETHHLYIPRNIVDLGDRLRCLGFAVRRSAEKFETFKQANRDAGRALRFH